MNERARWQHKSLLFRLIIGFLGAALFLAFYARVARLVYDHYAVTSFVVVGHNVDTASSDGIFAWLSDESTQGHLIHPDYTALTEELLKRFPLVGRVVWSRYNPRCLTCTVVAVQPVFMVNESLVAGDNGKLYKVSLFDAIPAELAHIRINPLWLTADRFAQVFSFFSRVPSSLLSAFQWSFKDPYLVSATPKAALDLPHRCICLVDERTVAGMPDTVDLMNRCQALKGDLEMGPGRAVCLFDFRFAGPVISKCITHKECMQLQRV